MSRRKKKAAHVNHERWLVSYADFITLLFAFFVVLCFLPGGSEEGLAGLSIHKGRISAARRVYGLSSGRNGYSGKHRRQAS